MTQPVDSGVAWAEPPPAAPEFIVRHVNRVLSRVPWAACERDNGRPVCVPADYADEVTRVYSGSWVVTRASRADQQRELAEYFVTEVPIVWLTFVPRGR